MAKELVSAYNLTQVQVAQILGTTQAAISQYINSKRAYKGTRQVHEILAKMEATAKVTAKRLAENEITWVEVTQDLCKLCLSFYDDGQSEPRDETDDYVNLG